MLKTFYRGNLLPLLNNYQGNIGNIQGNIQYDRPMTMTVLPWNGGKLPQQKFCSITPVVCTIKSLHIRNAKTP